MLWDIKYTQGAVNNTVHPEKLTEIGQSTRRSYAHTVHCRWRNSLWRHKIQQRATYFFGAIYFHSGVYRCSKLRPSKPDENDTAHQDPYFHSLPELFPFPFLLSPFLLSRFPFSFPFLLSSSSPLLLFSSSPLLLFSSSPLLLFSSSPLLLFSSSPLLPLLLFSSSPLLLFSSSSLLLFSFLLFSFSFPFLLSLFSFPFSFPCPFPCPFPFPFLFSLFPFSFPFPFPFSFFLYPFPFSFLLSLYTWNAVVTYRWRNRQLWFSKKKWTPDLNTKFKLT